MRLDGKFSNIIKHNNTRVFLVDSLNDGVVTYKEFHRLTCNLASELRSRGVQREDRIILLLPNCVEFVVMYFACIYLRAIAVPINQNLSSKEISFIISNSKSKYLIYAPSFSDKVTLCGDDVQNRICFVPRHEQKNITNQDLCLDLFSLPDEELFVPFENSSKDDIVAIMYTSGTTARPKGVVHRLRSMVRNAEVFAKESQITSDARFYHTFSIAYMAGFFNLILLPFLCGASVIIASVFNAKMSLTLWEVPSKYKANALWFNPTIMAALLKIDRGETGVNFCRNYVKHAFVGTAPLPVKIKKEFEDWYGIKVLENYGLSETLFVTTNSPKTPDLPGSVGRPLPGIALKIADNNGKQCGHRKEGEIFVQTPDLMVGYLHSTSGEILSLNPEDWFPTGDYGFLTEEQDLFITGRKKDIIIRGGINVSPKAIEEELLSHESVEEACVVGIPHELYGEDIVAVIKLKPNFDFENVKSSLARLAQKNLAPHQQPAFYMTIDEFPKGAGGKIQKHQLKEIIVNKLQLR